MARFIGSLLALLALAAINLGALALIVWVVVKVLRSMGVIG